MARFEFRYPLSASLITDWILHDSVPTTFRFGGAVNESSKPHQVLIRLYEHTNCCWYICDIAKQM